MLDRVETRFNFNIDGIKMTNMSEDQTIPGGRILNIDLQTKALKDENSLDPLCGVEFIIEFPVISD